MRHLPGLSRSPVPIEDIAAAGVPVPLDRVPQPVDGLAQVGFLGRLSGEVLPHAEQPLHQVGSFDQIAAIVLWREGNRRAGFAVRALRKEAMMGLGAADTRTGDV